MRIKWRLALERGNVDLVNTMMSYHGLSSNFSARASGENPLKSLAMMEDAIAYPGQVKVAARLIETGCELTVPDKFFMLPADWAMLSDNHPLAKLIVTETIRKLYKSGRAPYIPNIAPFFAINSDDIVRIPRFNAFDRNHRRLRDHFVQLKTKEPGFPTFTQTQEAFWSAINLDQTVMHAYEKMPWPSDPVAKALGLKERIEEGHKYVQQNADGVQRTLPHEEALELLRDRAGLQIARDMIKLRMRDFQ